MSGNYYRAFMPFVQERSDFSAGGRAGTGKIIIEAKQNAAKLYVSMQDVKPNSQYKVVLIAGIGDGFTGVNAGKLLINERGRGECKYDFTADSAFGSDISVEQFTIAALIVPKDGELIAPYVAYKNERPAWKAGFRYYTEPEKIDKTDETKDIIVTQVQSKIEPEYIEKPAEPSRDISHDKFKNVIRQFNEQFADDSPEPIEVSDEKPEQVYDDIDEARKIFLAGTPMSPFINSRKRESGVEWVRISPQELHCFSPNIRRLADFPMLMECYRTYKHLILGRLTQEGVFKLLLGIPDIYGERKKETAAKEGFEQFKTCSGEDVQDGAYGYWIAVL